MSSIDIMKRNSDCHKIQQYQQNEQYPLTEHKNTTTYDNENPVPAFGQLQQCGGMKVINGN